MNSDPVTFSARLVRLHTGVSLVVAADTESESLKMAIPVTALDEPSVRAIQTFGDLAVISGAA